MKAIISINIPPQEGNIPPQESIILFLEAINQIDFKIKLNVKKREVTVRRITEEDIDEIEDFIKGFFEIWKIEIDIDDFDELETDSGKDAELETDSAEEPKPIEDAKSRVQEDILKVLGSALDNIDHTKTIEEQIDGFLKEIGMPRNLLLNEAFVVASKIKKINFASVLTALGEKFPNMTEEKIRRELMSQFRDWLKTQPYYLRKHKNLSLMQVIKPVIKRIY